MNGRCATRSLRTIPTLHLPRLTVFFALCRARDHARRRLSFPLLPHSIVMPPHPAPRFTDRPDCVRCSVSRMVFVAFVALYCYALYVVVVPITTFYTGAYQCTVSALRGVLPSVFFGGCALRVRAVTHSQEDGPFCCRSACCCAGV